MQIDELTTFCEELEQHVEAVVTEWLAIATEEPWVRLEPKERLDDIRDLVRRILETSLCAPGELTVHRGKVEAAARHGFDRRRQGFDSALVFAGYHFIREAVRRHLTQCGLPHAVATDALLRVDIATTMASMASLRGYYREEHRGVWDTIVEEMAQESAELQRRPFDGD